MLYLQIESKLHLEEFEMRFQIGFLQMRLSGRSTWISKYLLRHSKRNTQRQRQEDNRLFGGQNDGPPFLMLPLWKAMSGHTNLITCK